MNEVLISIIVINLNRPLLGGAVLKCLDKQINKNFEVILVDNGSAESIPQTIIDSLTYPITVLKFSKKMHNSQINAALKVASGKIIMPFVADDDFFLDNTTDIIETIFAKEKHLDLLNLGKCSLDLHSHQIKYEPENSEFYTGQLFSYPAKDTALAYFSNWGIGEEKPSPLRTTEHPSAVVISRNILDKTIAAQKELCFGPFSDVPFLGLLFQTKYTHKIDLPLVLIGCNHPQDSSLMREYYGEKRTLKETKNRFSWNEYSKLIKHSPLKGITHINLGMDNHLQVLINNNFDISIPDDLRIDFFFRHLNEILKDNPWVDQSEKDFNEGMIELEKALERESVSNIPEILNNYKGIKLKHVKNTEKIQKNNEPITDYKHSYDLDLIYEVVESLSNNIRSNFTGDILFNSRPKVIDVKND